MILGLVAALAAAAPDPVDAARLVPETRAPIAARTAAPDSLAPPPAADSLVHPGATPAPAAADSLAGAAGAAPPGPGAEATSADSAGRARPRAPSATAGRGQRPPVSRFEQPRWVMLRSLAVPGWGQLHNRAWLKAVGVAGGESWLVVRLVDDLKRLDRLNDEVTEARRSGSDDDERAAVNAYNRQLEQVTARQWWLGAAVAYAMLDAYIDAHFRGFQLEFQNDPALPGGHPPSGARLSLRWSF